jgi:hypothetical protein
MEKILVEINNKANAIKFVSFIKNLNFVKTVKFEDELELKPLKDHDWILPGRPATDKEIEERLNKIQLEYESGNFLPVDKARERSLSSFRYATSSRCGISDFSLFLI